MRKPLFSLLALVSVVLGCGSGEGPRLSDEEIRIEACQRIDSTFVCADSIGERELQERLSAKAWLLVEDSSGAVISSKNAHQRMFPASLTKMLTGLLALERGNMGDSIVITDDVFLSKDSRVRLGDGYLLGNMIREMLMQSDNDAANAIAKHIGGDIPAFCQLMNERAARIGMDSTHFANPNGVHCDSTYSTARDLLVLARYCMRDSAFAGIAGTAFVDLPLLDGRHLPCQNTNQLLESYDGCFGVKTGYTRQAGDCLASAATRQGVTLYLVLLGSRSHSSRFAESAALLDFGFREIEAASR